MTFLVEIVFANPHQQINMTVECEHPLSVREAILQSGILNQIPEGSLDWQAVGIFGKIVDPESQVKKGDRIEIYRPLNSDPMEKRRSKVFIRHKRSGARK